jgi:hypothetical protein
MMFVPQSSLCSLGSFRHGDRESEISLSLPVSSLGSRSMMILEVWLLVISLSGSGETRFAVSTIAAEFARITQSTHRMYTNEFHEVR